jgi:hypothetical protein
MSETGGVSADVQPCAPKIKIESFSGVMLDMPFACQILHLDQCYWIWIGSGGAPSLSNLSTAIMTKYEKTPLATTIVGSDLNEGQGMAQRLSRRLGKMIFVSCDLQVSEGSEGQLAAYIERQLLQRLAAKAAA